MEMKSIKRLLPLVLLIVLCLSGCSKYKQIEIVSGNIESVKMLGLKGVGADLIVEVDNPAGKVSVSDAKADVFHFGKIIGSVALEPFVIKARSSEKHTLKAELTFDKSLSPLEIFAITKNLSADAFTLNIAADVKVGGITRHVCFDEVPASQIMKLIKK